VESLYGSQTGRFAGTWSDTVASVRRRARNLLTHEAAAVGAHGIVISGADLRVHRESAERYVEARSIGTAIAGFGPNRVRPANRKVGQRRRTPLRTAPTPEHLSVISVARMTSPEHQATT
jgi:hypothetical protein